MGKNGGLMLVIDGLSGQDLENATEPGFDPDHIYLGTHHIDWNGIYLQVAYLGLMCKSLRALVS